MYPSSVTTLYCSRGKPQYSMSPGASRTGNTTPRHTGAAESRKKRPISIIVDNQVSSSRNRCLLVEMMYKSTFEVVMFLLLIQVSNSLALGQYLRYIPLPNDKDTPRALSVVLSLPGFEPGTT